jgi:hypothetical protein
MKGKLGYGPRSNLWKWWDYVLQTKDATKLREYTYQKIYVYGKKMALAYPKFKEVFQSDERINKAGKALGAKLLNTLYGVKISPATYQRYKRKLINETRTSRPKDHI